jgi:hypothetical protein
MTDTDLMAGKKEGFVLRILRVIYMNVRAFVAGAALSWTSVPYLLRRRHETENLFILMTLLQMRGLSPLPPSRRLIMLPYVMPQILYWKRKLKLWDEVLETADLKHIGH